MSFEPIRNLDLPPAWHRTLTRLAAAIVLGGATLYLWIA